MLWTETLTHDLTMEGAGGAEIRCAEGEMRVPIDFRTAERDEWVAPAADDPKSLLATTKFITISIHYAKGNDFDA